MMVSFNVPAKIVDENGDTIWTSVTIMPSDDPGEDWLDISLADDVILPADGNLMFDDPAELMRALKLAAEERSGFLAEDGREVEARA